MKVLDKIVMSEYAPNNPNVLWVKEGILHKMENGKWIPIGDGNDGKEGKPGYTPQKGIDYWTANDKQEIVNEAIAEIVNPIVFKGTLGVGGTITSLPSANESNHGWQYKVITAGTYNGISANVGDSFVSNGASWILSSNTEADLVMPQGFDVNGSVVSFAEGYSLITSKEKAYWNDSLILENALYSVYNLTLEYSTNIPNVANEHNWTVNSILNEKGAIVSSNNEYYVSDFIDYDGSYSAPSCIEFFPVDNAYSYDSICFYKSADHSFVKSFPIISKSKKIIAIPKGYSLRFVTKNRSYLKIARSIYGHPYKTQIEDNSVTTSKIADNSVTSSKLRNGAIVPSKIEGATIMTEQKSFTVRRGTIVEYLSGQIFTNNGGSKTEPIGKGNLITSSRFSTDIYAIDSQWKYVDLSSVRVGVYGGAFLVNVTDTTTTYAFQTDNGGGIMKIPDGVNYLAITSQNNSLYSYFTALEEKVFFSLDGLIIKNNNFRITSTPNNQWQGKKVGIIGTSVAYGSNATTAYAKIASERLGFEIIPAGMPGQAIHTKEDGSPMIYGSTSLSKSECSNYGFNIPTNAKPINGADWKPGTSNYNNYWRTWENIFNEQNADVDLWIFAVAPNNTNFDDSDWEAFDKNNWKYTDNSSFDSHRKTFLGALLFLMNKMYECNPNARMVLLLDSAFAYSQGKEDMLKVSTRWNIPLIDLWGKINTSPKSLAVVKSKDGTDNHPSTFGQERLGDIFTNELLLIS